MNRRVVAFFVFTVTLTGQEPEIQLSRVAGDLRNPTDIQTPRDGTGRLFIVEQAGTIRVLKDGRLLAAPFLNISSRTRVSGECGLLGLAFPPGFATKQYFYVNYTNPLCNQTTVARYRVSANGDAADAGSEQVVLTQRQPFSNHNAGQLAFGPDGFLYVGFGDGGSARDPQGNGQNRMTWLGKMLRLDVESNLSAYVVPASNPFTGDARTLPEIWALGLRNPWRYSFDRETGDLWIADVGQGRAEEIDFQRASSAGGENYGWAPMEGLQCLVPGCDQTGLIRPVHEYTRERGDISVTGGYVYRGRSAASLGGTYLYGDYQSGRIWGLRREGERFVNRLLLDSPYNISTFGEDEAGELYVADHSGGGLYRVLAPQAPRFTQQSVVNAASFEMGLSPGSAATVFASGITDGPGIRSAAALPLPQSLGGVRVTVGGRVAPLYAVANVNGQEQVNFQVPFETIGTAATVVVDRDGQASAPVEVAVTALQPAVFTLGSGQAILVRAANNTLASSLRAGDNIYFYATGLGPVANGPGTGNAAPRAPLAGALNDVAVTVDGVRLETQFAGLAPDLAGVYQVNVRVTPGIGAGLKDLVVSVGGVRSRAVKVVVE